MSIFDFAMQMEQDGEKYYRSLAAQTDAPGLRLIFTRLAEDEAQHFTLFSKFKDIAAFNTSGTTILEDAKNIFATMREKKEVISIHGQAEAYASALEMEKKSYAFYEETAAKSSDPAEAKLLRAIATEERRHYRLLEALLEFISRPEQWLENAEFASIAEY